MRTIWYLVEKEFLQLRRNPMMMTIVLIMPFFQMILLAYAADFEIKELKLWIIDHDQSTLSRQLTQKFQATPYFLIAGYTFSPDEADDAMTHDRADLILTIPAGFEKDLIRENKSDVQLIANAIDGLRGSLAVTYASQVILSYNQAIREEYVRRLGIPVQLQQGQINFTWSNWFNPRMDYKTYMVPGILALLITMIGLFMSSMNIVREKEIGTIEQINVSPIRKYQFVLGKMIPYWCVGMFEMSAGLVLAWLLYGITIEGNPLALVVIAMLFMVLVLGLGLFFSTLSETQQQAVFVSWFFMVIFLFLSGMFTAVENMPDWAQAIANCNPLRYFIEAIRMIMLKGSDLMDLREHVMILGASAVFIYTMAIWRYRKIS
ncbi:MAG: ABC transporter permease [Bacteroidia bacterium]|nr:ABC transporter permease [Bacteroidia bacterium]